MGKDSSNIGIILDHLLIASVIAMCPVMPRQSFAITAVQTSKTIEYHHDIGVFRSELRVPLTVKDVKIGIPEKHLATRLSRSIEDPRVEPLQLTIENNEDRILELAGKVAKPNYRLALANHLKTNFLAGEEIPGTSLRLVSLDQKAFNYIDTEAFDSLFSKVHHKLSIDASALKNNSKLKNSLLKQMSPFFSSHDLAQINRKILNEKSISIDEDLLPPFARHRVANHTIFRGPNCFHAALAFQSPKLASSAFVNVRREQGYHQDMVNYDELWRILQRSFYEVDPARRDLQYGDMIVFFETKDATPNFVDFKTLRHAATYLIGGYVFAKGSKSANSPYLVRTLGEEWETWSKYTKKLGVKVFRRNLKRVSTTVPADPYDWVY